MHIHFDKQNNKIQIKANVKIIPRKFQKEAKPLCINNTNICPEAVLSIPVQIMKSYSNCVMTCRERHIVLFMDTQVFNELLKIWSIGRNRIL